MKMLNPSVDLERFFDDAVCSPDRILLIDYDGTIAPFRIERENAVPYPGVLPILESIMRSDRCRLVLITGRSLSDLARIVDLKPLPEIWGSHGWERRTAEGDLEVLEPARSITEGIEEAWRIADAKGLAHRCEKKKASMALHWRGLDDRTVGKIRDGIERDWKAIAAETGLSVHEFNGGIELRASGRDKGYAVETIIKESEEGSTIAYLGDDITDEDAFRALGNAGLGILVSKSFHDTAADIWIIPPDELLVFLERWNNACGG